MSPCGDTQKAVRCLALELIIRYILEDLHHGGVNGIVKRENKVRRAVEQPEKRTKEEWSKWNVHRRTVAQESLFRWTQEQVGVFKLHLHSKNTGMACRRVVHLCFVLFSRQFGVSEGGCNTFLCPRTKF